MHDATLLAKLKRDIVNGNTVIIVGTGVSSAVCERQKIEGCEVATWPGLLKHGISRLNGEGLLCVEDVERYTRLIDVNNTDTLVDVAGIISGRLIKRSPGTYKRWLKDTVGSLRVANPAVLLALHKLPGILATLNYDNLIEQGTRRTSYHWQQHDNVEDILRHDIMDGVLHLHGYFDVPESVVLGLESYNKLVSNAHAQTVLRLFSLERTLLFVGCGATLEDPNFTRLLEWAEEALKHSSHVHFLLCRDQELETKRSDLPSWIRSISYGPDYSNLAPFLEGLVQSNDLALPPPSFSNPLSAFNYEAYADRIRDKYKRVKFEKIDTTAGERRRLELIRVFVPQSVRDCQEYWPSVFERPKEEQERLKEGVDIKEGNRSEEENALLLQRYFSLPPRNILKLVGDASLTRLVLLGDPGSGKSSVLQAFMLLWANCSHRRRERMQLPVFIELRFASVWFNRNVCDFLGYLYEDPNALMSLEVGWMKQELRAGRVCVFFDGLDDIFDWSQREKMATAIQRFADEYRETGSRFVVTSRPIEYRGDTFRDANFRHFKLEDMDDAQISRFLKRWYREVDSQTEKPEKRREKCQRLAAAIQKDSSIRQLASNPLLLTMIAILNRSADLPRNRAALYAKCTQLLLVGWKVEEAFSEDLNLSRYAVVIKQPEKERMLCRVSREMHAGDDRLYNSLEESKVEAAFQKEVETFTRNGDPVAIVKALIQHLRGRNFILCSLRPGFYGFVHGTIQEYYYALDIKQRFEQSQMLDASVDPDQIFLTRWSNPAWHEVLCLLCGLLQRDYVARILAHLRTLKDDSSQFPPQVLAARCFREVEEPWKLTGLSYNLRADLVNIIRGSYIGSYPSQDRKDAVRKAALETLVLGWRDDPQTLLWLKEHGQTDRDWTVRRAVCEILTFGWRDDPQTFDWLVLHGGKDGEWAVRCAVAHNLALGWRGDPDTLSLLKSWIWDDENYAVRQATLRALALNWPDNDEVFALLLERARIDDDPRVRQTAIEELAKGWHDNPDVLALLLERVSEQEHSGVRQTAIKALASGWRGNLHALVPLLQWVREENDQYERQLVIEALASGWRDNDEVFARLLELVREDPEVRVRQTAIEELAKGWRNNPDVLALLRGRVSEDNDPRFRQTAIEILALNWPDNDEVLALLLELAENDQDDEVRYTALDVLKRSAQALTLLIKQAREDENYAVRQNTIKALALNWPDNSEVFAHLLAWARNDDDPRVRQILIEALAAGWGSDPALLTLLLERATEDTAASVRRTATDTLTSGWPEHPEVLALHKEQIRLKQWLRTRWPVRPSSRMPMV